ncbi:MAG: DUF6036 family nucleotidyltransferase [Candidatus Omnitrophota bacterium]
MKIEKDYEDLLKLFNKYKVKYCVVGAFAVAFYALPRYTKDIDILVEPTMENAAKIVKALNSFGFNSLNLKGEDFAYCGRIIQLGYEPIRIDILTSISGVDFKEVWKNRKKTNYGKIKIFFIGKKELIKSKKASSRKQDKIDLDIIVKTSEPKAKRIVRDKRKRI